MKVGIIGLDTPHGVEFTKILNDPRATGDLAGLAVVAGFPGGSPDLPCSRDCVKQCTEELRAMGVAIVDSVEKLVERVDLVLLESQEGRPHLEQATPALAAGKPTYIDKPVAASLADAVRIYQLARELGTPCFSSSAIRFIPAVVGLRDNPQLGRIVGCDAYSPSMMLEYHSDLFYYGIHGVETLFTIMGEGCESVARVYSEGTELVTGVWKDGRVGAFRGIRDGLPAYGATVYGTSGVAHDGIEEGCATDVYRPLVRAIARFFKTGKPPVTPEQTLEIYAFMEAAHQSRRRGGCTVMLEEVLQKARQDAAAKR
jgi:predicted dehydrogenase